MGLKWDCPAEETCSAWALSDFMDCICNQRDIISFVLGVTSILCWGVAEIPQIVVNWRSGNVEGISLAFLFIWMMGDVFNLLGCWIDPGTLPTQFYLSVLYCSTTLLLVVKQTSSTWTSSRDAPYWPAAEHLLGASPPRRYGDVEGSYHSDSNLALTPAIATQSLPVLSSRGRPPMAVTASLPVRPYSRESGVHVGSLPALPVSRSPGTYSGSWRPLTLSNSYHGSGIGSPMLHRGLVFSSLGITGVTLIALSPMDGSQGVLSLVGSERRQLLERNEGKEIATSVGLILGWLMTCIYLTGRLPQMVLNWSRDFVMGVSVPTVVCAFLGNATYLGSILVRGVEWSKLKPVLPWVVDITFCLLMDCFMTLQFLFRHRKDGYTILE